MGLTISSLFSNLFGFSADTVECKNISITMWDVRGQPHGGNHSHNTIFVIDSNDMDRVSETREDLQRMNERYRLPDVLLVILTDKQDSPNATNAAEITDQLRLKGLIQSTWSIKPGACDTSGDRLLEDLE